ncbi:16S rRNA (guanine(527)-N(7))-methyltransferase RsmG [Testudinibacter aquarius]|uniref:Ribosomal RNA small subunit methyltransferase G n=1 Tax=Testudinibacter aquarius TaxID=1524974 RepID=A0A4R3YCA7_9PAST|nr:16S rRNA methyltransferase G [Testudinibacter aquarius]TCV89451.1 16S rRNA m(7)G-527 methyltransferase [Testudinibacter aquarius]TNG91597.1 16S rRNA (guanine(527)-N(7))-methyltransferase RsmG [Testudinibacter aquarius]
MKLYNRLDQLLAQTVLSLTDQQKQQLVAFVELLDKWNKAYNLTSVRDPHEMLIKHILDSLVVSPYLQGKRFIDVGTGPGLPGIPLAIINPDQHYFLLDSLGKRIIFIRQVIRQLGLTNVTPIQSRVEQYQPEVRFDGVLSRAFASLKDMTEWCQHLLDQSGHFYALKGIYHSDELQQLDLQFQLQQKIKLMVPELVGERHLVILSKTDKQ